MERRASIARPRPCHPMKAFIVTRWAVEQQGQCSVRSVWWTEKYIGGRVLCCCANGLEGMGFHEKNRKG